MHGEAWGTSVALDTCSPTGTREDLPDARPRVTESSSSSAVGKAHDRAQGDRGTAGARAQGA